MAGRPTTYTDKAANTICERISQGESVAKICKDSDMPSLRTVWQWKRANPQFSLDYDDAKDACAEHYADKILEIADNTALSTHDRRIMIDARKWVSGRMKPKNDVEQPEPQLVDDFEDKKDELLAMLKKEFNK